MNNDTFQWSDQKAKEFAQFCQGRVVVFVEEELEKFKQSKMPKTERPSLGVMPEWVWKETRANGLSFAISRHEIEKMEVPQAWVDELNEINNWLANRKNATPKKEWEVIKLQNKHGGTVYKEEKYSWEHIGVRSFDWYKIVSVKRLSDNEVFTVGDKIQMYQTEPIERFEIRKDDGKMIVYFKTAWANITELQKPAPEQPKKDRIVVSGLVFQKEAEWNGYKDVQYLLATRQRIPEEKFQAIKAAIERVLNDESNMTIFERILDDFDKNIQEAEERGFNAARERNVIMEKYKTFQDYLNHQIDKE